MSETKLINKLSYDYLRGIYDMSVRNNLASAVFTAYSDPFMFADLLYSKKDVNEFIKDMNKFYQKKSKCDDTFIRSIRYDEKYIFKLFDEFVEALAKKIDENGFYKAVYDKDEYALSVIDVAKAFEVRKCQL